LREVQRLECLLLLLLEFVEQAVSSIFGLVLCCRSRQTLPLCPPIKQPRLHLKALVSWGLSLIVEEDLIEKLNVHLNLRGQLFHLIVFEGIEVPSEVDIKFVIIILSRQLREIFFLHWLKRDCF
jgi:hypothetical protein